MCVLQSKVLEHRGCTSQFDLVTLRRASEGVTSVIKRKHTHTHKTTTTTNNNNNNKTEEQMDKSEAGIRICEEGELRRDLQS